MSDLVWNYMTGQLRPGHATLLPAFAARSEATLATTPHHRDVRYGSHERCRFDFFPAAPGAPWWRSSTPATGRAATRTTFLFLAEPFLRAGISWAAVNYPLCPQTSFDGLMAAVMTALPAIRAHSGAAHVVAAGHSAGGHIAAELGLAGLADAVAALSGVYDLAPMLSTPLNTALRLDQESAQRHSPLFRVGPAAPRGTFIVGGDETEAFQEQTARMAASWPGGRSITGPAADHFTLLEQLADQTSAVFAAVVSSLQNHL